MSPNIRWGVIEEEIPVDLWPTHLHMNTHRIAKRLTMGFFVILCWAVLLAVWGHIGPIDRGGHALEASRSCLTLDKDRE